MTTCYYHIFMYVHSVPMHTQTLIMHGYMMSASIYVHVHSDFVQTQIMIMQIICKHAMGSLATIQQKGSVYNCCLHAPTHLLIHADFRIPPGLTHDYRQCVCMIPSNMHNYCVCMDTECREIITDRVLHVYHSLCVFAWIPNIGA